MNPQPLLSGAIPEAMHLLDTDLEALNDAERQVLRALTGAAAPEAGELLPEPRRFPIWKIPQLDALTYPIIRAAYAAAIDPDVLRVRLEGDIGTGKSWLGELLTLEACYQLAVAERCPWGFDPSTPRILAFVSADESVAESRVRFCTTVIREHRDVFPSTPGVPVQIESLCIRDAAILGKNLVHVVFDGVPKTDRGELMRQHVERRLLSRTGGKGPARIVDIEAFTSREEWNGKPEGVIVHRDSAFGMKRLTMRLRNDRGDVYA